jgi:hypothetical protein
MDDISGIIMAFGPPDPPARVFLTAIQPGGTLKAVDTRGLQSPSATATTVEMAPRRCVVHRAAARLRGWRKPE